MLVKLKIFTWSACDSVQSELPVTHGCRQMSLWGLLFQLSIASSYTTPIAKALCLTVHWYLWVTVTHTDSTRAQVPVLSNIPFLFFFRPTYEIRGYIFRNLQQVLVILHVLNPPFSQSVRNLQTSLWPCVPLEAFCVCVKHRFAPALPRVFCQTSYQIWQVIAV